MTLAAPVYQYACPKCLVPMGEWCVRVRKLRPVRLQPPEALLNAHGERYAVWKAWEQPDLFEMALDGVRTAMYEETP